MLKEPVIVIDVRNYLLISPSKAYIDRLKRKLRKDYSIKIKGLLFFNVKIMRDKYHTIL